MMLINSCLSSLLWKMKELVTMNQVHISREMQGKLTVANLACYYYQFRNHLELVSLSICTKGSKSKRHTHHMLIPKEELDIPELAYHVPPSLANQKHFNTYHYCHRIVKLVHGREIRDLIDIAQIYDGEILHLVRDFGKHIILAQTVGVSILAKADDDKTIILAQDGLVNVPRRVQVRQNHRTHGVSLFRSTE